MVGGSCPALFGDGNKGLVRVNRIYGNKRKLFAICSGGTTNCSRGWQLRHIVEGKYPSLPFELAPVPSLLLVSQKLHNVPDLQSQLILIGRTEVKDGSEELLGCRNEKTVCSVGTCFTATASLEQQLMCTHSPVTVCCEVVRGSPRAEGLTVTPAGRDVVDMVSFLADSEHKRSDVSSTSSARCGHYLSTLPHYHTTHQLKYRYKQQLCVSVYKCVHRHTHACIHAHTHTITFLQTPFHGSAQSTHF